MDATPTRGVSWSRPYVAGTSVRSSGSSSSPIFHVDAESRRAGETVAQRFERRQRESAPFVAELRIWLEARLGDVEPKSTLGNALGYIHKQWHRLTRFMRDPVMELTNNDVERGLRTWVLDRKTWMFCGHAQSARRTADALTIIVTCKNLGVDPRCYIRDTLRRILDGEKDLEALLPENYEPRPVGASRFPRHRWRSERAQRGAGLTFSRKNARVTSASCAPSRRLSSRNSDHSASCSDSVVRTHTVPSC